MTRDKIVIGALYTGLLDKLDENIEAKRPYLARSIMLHHNDNAPSHKRGIVKDKLTELRYESLQYQTGSPDGTPTDFDLFQFQKLSGMHSTTNK